jgi:hypothetical protein
VTDVRFSRLMARREAPARKRMVIRSAAVYASALMGALVRIYSDSISSS